MRPVLLAAALALAAGLPTGAALAQAGPRGCALQPRADPPGQVLVCADGLSIAFEAGTEARLVDGNRDGRPERAELLGKALLVETPPGRTRPFQILTPHAIASVRGTVWAVDVADERSSVFVARGAVAVRRPGRPAVTLRAGDGVDVTAADAPLEVRRWPPERAAALLARFGR
jgi:ferric-dicitrate binding protein FerR (iron transport regulator)